MLRTTNSYSGKPLRLGHLPPHVRRYAESVGGIVSTRELRALGVDQTTLELYRDYAALQAVRQGWHCLPEVGTVHRLAWRFGGPLACISALAVHDARSSGTTIDELLPGTPLHVCLPSNAARVPTPTVLALRWGIELPLEPIIHWSSRAYGSGDRRAVSRAVALRQADQCDRRAGGAPGSASD